MAWAPTAMEWAALRGSATVASLAVLGCTPLAVALASWMAGSRWRGKLWVDALLLTPMVISPALVGMALIRAWPLAVSAGLVPDVVPGGTSPVLQAGWVAAASVLTLPLMVRAMRPGFERQDPWHRSVALTLGASPWQAWWTVTLPAARPAVLGAMALGWAAAWGETGAAMMLAQAAAPDEREGALTAPLALSAAPLGEPGVLAWCSLAVALLATLACEWTRRRSHAVLHRGHVTIGAGRG